MNTKTKPNYKRGNGETIYKDLRRDAQEIMAELEPKKMFQIRFKAVLFPLLYLGAWLAAMTWGKTP